MQPIYFFLHATYFHFPGWGMHNQESENRLQAQNILPSAMGSVAASGATRYASSSPGKVEKKYETQNILRNTKYY